MKKIIARIVAFVVCILAAWAIYHGVKEAYFNESINDFIVQGQNFAQGELVEPSEVEDNSANGKFVHEIAVYWRRFQDLNNEMDTETNKMLGVFDAKNLVSADAINANLEKMDEYRALIQKDNDLIEKNAENFIVEVGKIEQEDLLIGNINDVKAEFASDKEFRKSIADIRKTIASYMYSALEFLATRQPNLSFAPNGAITFTNEADQKYFYDLMEVIRQADLMLKNKLAENRDETRGNVADIKKAFQNQ